MQTGSGAGSRQPKKVRLACERCRDRRIKCDGKVPACENCSKAQVPCIDVDTRTSAGRISRAFQLNAAARIEWLENIIRTRLPDVDLSAGPQLLNADATGLNNSGGPASPAPSSDQAPQSNLAIGQNRGIKRSHPAPTQEHAQTQSVEQSARAMALHLGLLSLDVNSSQVHYLGSSSGSLFTPMLQTDREDPSSVSSASSHETADGNQPDPFDVFEQSEENRQENHHIIEVRRLYETLRTDLPSRRDCNHLTNMFFRHFHAEYPFLHRPTIEIMTDALYRCSTCPAETSLQHNGWPAHQQWFPCNGEDPQNENSSKQISISIFAAAVQLFLILGVSANLKTQKRDYQYDPIKFHEAAKACLDHAISKISLPALQIILLLILRSFTSTERSNTWATVHLGMAFAIELGLHRDASACNSFSAAVHQMRRRVFYCMYSLERRLSAIQGRPIGFSDDTLDTSLPELIQINPSDLKAVADQSFLPFSIQMFKIAQLVSRIKHSFYLLPKRTPTMQADASFYEIQEQLRAELDTWDAECARAVQCIPQQERGWLSAKLKIDYHATMVLLYQPSQVFIRPSEESLQRCFKHTVERLRVYGTLYDSDKLFFSWRNIHGIFLAGSTLLYCLWTSPSIQSSNSFSKLASDIRLCSNLLSAAGEWWPLVRKARASFERLASHTLQALTDKSGRQLRQPTSTVAALSAIDPALTKPSSTELFRSPDELEIEHILNSVLQRETQLPDMLEELGELSHTADGFADLWGDFDFQHDFGHPGHTDQQAFVDATQQARNESRDLNHYLQSPSP